MNNKPVLKQLCRLSLLGALCGLGVMQAQAQAPAAGALNKADRQIVIDIAQANIAEVAAGKLAAAKGGSADVKAFGQQMVDDHTKGLQDAQQVAQGKNIALPTEPDARHKKMADKLNRLSGAAFDKAYLAQAGVADHQAVHDKLLRAQKRAADADVKALVARTQPVVDQHLAHVQQLADARGVGGNPSGGNTDNPLNPANPTTNASAPGKSK